MKKQLITLVVILGATTLVVTMPRARSQVAIPIDPITIQQPVTVTKNVTVSAVPLKTISFDLENKVITLQLSPASSAYTAGNGTIRLTGDDYNFVRDRMLNPFIQAIAPLLRAKIASQ